MKNHKNSVFFQLVNFIGLVAVLLPSKSFAIREVDCSNVKDIVKEAVEYQLTGAADSNLPLTCAKKMKWKYFDPNHEDREIVKESDIPKDWIWFEKNRDLYEIESFQKSGPKFDIKVRFSINGKTYKQTVVYEPWDLYQKELGVCGLVYNDDKPVIYRSDCKK